MIRRLEAFAIGAGQNEFFFSANTGEAEEVSVTSRRVANSRDSMLIIKNVASPSVFPRSLRLRRN